MSGKEILLRLAFRIRCLRGNLLREKNRQEGDEDDNGGDYIRHRAVTRTGKLAEDPNGERGLLAGSKCGDDDFIEGKREGQHAACKQSSCDIGQDNITESLKRIRAQVHRCFDHRSAGAAETREHVVINYNDAKCRVADDDRPKREGDVQTADGSAQGDAGNDTRQGNRQHQKKRDGFAAKKLLR